MKHCMQNHTMNALALSLSQQCSAEQHSPSAGCQFGKHLQILPPELEPQNIAWFSMQGSKSLKLGESTTKWTFCSLLTVFQQGSLIYKVIYVLWKSR